MKIWAKTDGDVKEGKYLVVRRDGTIPPWPHFVIGGYDPAGDHALRSYADKARALGFDPEYCESVRELAGDFGLLVVKHVGKADPDAGPHRTDNAYVVAMMRGESDVRHLTAALDECLACGRQVAALANRSDDPKLSAALKFIAELIDTSLSRQLP